jgi:hypothetical protein
MQPQLHARLFKQASLDAMPLSTWMRHVSALEAARREREQAKERKAEKAAEADAAVAVL